MARFLGAKEVATLFARSCRRACLPLAYSQGFHPLPRLSFGPALPVGMESKEEFLDILLHEVMPAKEVQQRLNAELPSGFQIQQVQQIDLDRPSIDVSIATQRYQVALDTLPLEKRDPSFVQERLGQFHHAQTFPIRKRTRHRERTLDAKQLIPAITLETPLALSIAIAMTEVGTLKPHEFIGALLTLSPQEVKLLRVTKTVTQFRSDAFSQKGPLHHEQEPLPTTG